MAFDPTSDRWNEPCDLCGNVDYESVKAFDGMRGLRCCECGLVTLVPDEHLNGANSTLMKAGIDDLLLSQVLEEAAGKHLRSVLIIGIDHLLAGMNPGVVGARLTLLVDPGTTLDADTSVVVHDVTLETAPFLPDQFDLIVCARHIGSFDSPATLFEKARLWLATGGTLVVGGMNSASLPARLWRANWIRTHATGARHLLDADNLRAYADRFGYEVKRLRMKSSLADVAVVAGNGAPSGVLQTLVAPVALTANILNMGDSFIATLVKGGAAVRPLPRRITNEEERSPGLAPAMYTSVQRERT